MKPTVKVSIGRIAFTLDEDAYNLLNNYLKVIKAHFAKSPEGNEITDDIETRMGELLQMKQGNQNRVVSVADAQEVINIMGSPKDFGDEIEDDDTTEVPPKKNVIADEETTFEESFRSKKLYRDPEGGILGGVCSGLGHYFKIDAVAIRLILVVMTFGFNFIYSKIGLYVAAGYILLWLIVPAAKTFKEKIVMKGTTTRVEDIEENRVNTSRGYRGRWLSKVLEVSVRILAGFIALVSLACLLGVIACFIWIFFLSPDVHNLQIFLSGLGISLSNMNISALLGAIIPSFIIFYLSAKVAFSFKLKKRDLAIILIALGFWIGAVGYLLFKGGKVTKEYRHRAFSEEVLDMNTKSDTIYVMLEDKYKKAEPLLEMSYYRKYSLFEESNTSESEQDDTVDVNIDIKEISKNFNLPSFFLLKNEGVDEIFYLPAVVIKQDSLAQDVKVEVKKRAYSRSQHLAKIKLEERKQECVVIDSLLSISPTLYQSKDNWGTESFDIKITAPINKTIIVDKYILSRGYRIIK